MPGQRQFAWGRGEEMTVWKFKDKADSISKNIKEILEQTVNSSVFFFYILRAKAFQFMRQKTKK